MNIIAAITMLFIGLVALAGWLAYRRYKDRKIFRKDISQARAILLLVIAAIIFVVIFSFLQFSQVNVAGAGSYDLGNMNQAIWNTAHGDILRMTTVYPFTSRLFIHVEPIFLLFVPFYYLWQDPKMLLVVQSILLALTVFPLYGLFKRATGWHLGGALAGLLFLLLPSLHLSMFFQFHSLLLSVPFLVAGMYFFERRRFSLAFIVFLASMMCREELGFVVAAYGFVFLFQAHARRFALSLIGTGLAWGAIAYGIIIPAAQMEGVFFQSGFFVWFGGASLTLSTFITLIVLCAFFLLFVSSQFFFLSYKRVLYLAPALVFAPHMLFRADPEYLFLGYTHYTLMIGIIFFIAAFFAMKELVVRTHAQRGMFLLLIMIGISVFLSAYTYQATRFVHQSTGSFKTEERQLALEHARTFVSRQDSLIVSPTLLLPFSGRKDLFMTSWGNPYRADVVMLDKEAHTANCGTDDRNIVTAANASCVGDWSWYELYIEELPKHGYQLELDEAGIRVYKRKELQSP